MVRVVTTKTIILLVVIVSFMALFIILLFTGAFKNILQEKPKGTDIGSAVTSCQVSCATQSVIDYCRKFIIIGAAENDVNLLSSYTNVSSVNGEIVVQNVDCSVLAKVGKLDCDLRC